MNIRIYNADAVNAMSAKLDQLGSKVDASLDLQERSLNLVDVIAAKQSGRLTT